MAIPLGRNSISYDYYRNIISIGDTLMPPDPQTLFRICDILFATNPVFQSAVSRLAETPITKLAFKTSDDKKSSTDLEKYYLERLKINEIDLKISYDYMTYGNAYAVPHFKLHRYLVCPACSKKSDVQSNAVQELGKNPYARIVKQYTPGGIEKDPAPIDTILTEYRAESIMESGNFEIKFKSSAKSAKTKGSLDPESYQISGKCPKCKQNVEFRRVERYNSDKEGFKVIIIPPKDIYVDTNQISDISRLYWRVPQRQVSAIKSFDVGHWANDNWNVLIHAMNMRMPEIKKYWHFGNIGPSGIYPGIGFPRALSVMKEIFYIFIMTRSNEQVAINRITDFNILFADVNTKGDSLNMGFNPELIQGYFDKLIKTFHDDKGFTGYAPFPVGNIKLFGDGRSQILSNEIEMSYRLVCAALGYPYDLLYGTSNFTSNIIMNRLVINNAEVFRSKINAFMSSIHKTVFRSDNGTPYLAEIEDQYSQAEKDQKLNLAMNGKYPMEDLYKALNLGDWSASQDKIKSDIEYQADLAGFQLSNQARSQRQIDSEGLDYQNSVQQTGTPVLNDQDFDQKQVQDQEAQNQAQVQQMTSKQIYSWAYQFIAVLEKLEPTARKREMLKFDQIVSSDYPELAQVVHQLYTQYFNSKEDQVKFTDNVTGSEMGTMDSAMDPADVYGRMSNVKNTVQKKPAQAQPAQPGQPGQPTAGPAETPAEDAGTHAPRLM